LSSADRQEESFYSVLTEEEKLGENKRGERGGSEALHRQANIRK